jgi:putative ABC transport system permease protein
MMLAIRAPRPLDHVAAVRRAIAETDALQPVFEVDTLDALVQRSISPQRQIAGIMTVFAGAAAGLALVGLYALVAYGVRQRTREVGLRLALGATPRAVVTRMMGGAMSLVLLGTQAGVGAALAAGAALGKLLFGLPPIDWMTFVAVPMALVAAAGLACYLPARRAARIDPAMALRD